MEAVGGILLSENNRGALKGERNQKAMPLTGSVMRRKRFSDITNITSNGKSERSEGGEQENPNGEPTKSAKDYIAMLLKENNALLRLVDERNKIIEITGMELQKLKISLQKANQQNWQLAQANSLMLAELNLGKDRLKALQHELGCTVAALRSKTLELQEEKKLHKQTKLKEKIGTEESHLKPNEVVVETPHPAKCTEPSNTNRKRTLRSRSLGPTTVTLQATSKEKDEGRRKSSRRRVGNAKTGLCEPTDNLFEIEDLKLPIRSHDDSCSGPTPPTASYTVRNEDHLGDQSVSPQHQNLCARRSSLARPMRRAAEKVNSYKEAPVNIKMRRAEKIQRHRTRTIRKMRGAHKEDGGGGTPTLSQSRRGSGRRRQHRRDMNSAFMNP